MKNFIFTITAIIFTTFFTTTSISAKSFFAPLDTISKKATTCIFEMNDAPIRLSDFQLTNIVEFEEEFIEEPSKPSIVNLKPVPRNFTGYKIEVIKVYNEPLEYSHRIFSTYDEVMIERIGESQYIYLIEAFKNSKEATAFINKKSSTKNLKVVQYKNGIRVN